MIIACIRANSCNVQLVKWGIYRPTERPAHRDHALAPCDVLKVEAA